GAEAILEIGKESGGVGSGNVERIDDAGDRAHGLEQAVKGSHQAEKHQQAGEIARGILGLVEAVADRIEDGAHGGGRDYGLPDAFAQDAGDWRQQDGRAHIGGRAVLQRIDPFYFGKQADDLAEAEEDADEKSQENHRVDERVGPEEGDDIGEKDGRDQRHQHQEDHDLDEINGGTGEVVGIVALRHSA